MTVSPVLDAAGQRRAPATLPGYHAGRPRWDQAPVRAAPAAPRPRTRARPGGRAAEPHPAPTRTYQPRHDLHLSPGDRPRGDHHRRARTSRADDVGQRRAAPLIASDRSAERKRLTRFRFALAKRAPRRVSPRRSRLVASVSRSPIETPANPREQERALARTSCSRVRSCVFEAMLERPPGAVLSQVPVAVAIVEGCRTGDSPAVRAWLSVRAWAGAPNRGSAGRRRLAASRCAVPAIQDRERAPKA
jgi:hypothetical protein